MKEEALAKLDREYEKGTFSRHAQVMKRAVRSALETFIGQDEEFAQAVAQGGSFADCMKAVSKDVGNGISDLEAYRRAVTFYFPGADVVFEMRVLVNPEDAEADSGEIKLELSDFF